MKYNHLYQDRENAGPSNIIYFNTRVCVIPSEPQTSGLYYKRLRDLYCLSVQGTVITARTMEQYSNDVGNITHFCVSPPFKTRSIAAVTSCNSTQTLICKHIHIWIQVFWDVVLNIMVTNSRLLRRNKPSAS